MNPTSRFPRKRSASDISSSSDTSQTNPPVIHTDSYATKHIKTAQNQDDDTKPPAISHKLKETFTPTKDQPQAFSQAERFIFQLPSLTEAKKEEHLKKLPLETVLKIYKQAPKQDYFLIEKTVLQKAPQDISSLPSDTQNTYQEIKRKNFSNIFYSLSNPNSNQKKSLESYHFIRSALNLSKVTDTQALKEAQEWVKEDEKIQPRLQLE